MKKGLHSRPAIMAALVLTAALTACSGGGSHSESSGTTTTTGRAAAASIAPTTTSTTVVVPEYDPAKNARRDVNPGACVDGDKGWSFEGTVTNSTPRSRGYSIVVDFITVPGNTVMATRVVTVPTVAPQATQNWTVSDALPGQKDLTCVVRQALAV